MSLPDKYDLKKMDYSHFGEPFVRLASTNYIYLDWLDWTYFGQPFWGLSGVGIRGNTYTSAYLDGFSYDRESSISVYVFGRDPCSNISAYTAGHLFAKSKQKAYTNATKTLVFESFPAFLDGNIITTTSTHAHVVGPTDTVTGNIKAYLYGINRNSISAYLDGIEASTNYITLTAGTLSKRFKVLQQDYDDGREERSEEIHKTISGGLEHSLGQIYTTWSMIIQTKAYETDSNYGTRDDLEYFYSQKEITFVNHKGHEYTVHVVGGLTKNLLTTMIEGNDAVYLYRLQLMK